MLNGGKCLDDGQRVSDYTSEDGVSRAIVKEERSFVDLDHHALQPRFLECE